MTTDCIFCKIVNKTIPSDILYEDDTLVVFKDLHPQAPVHLLIVPKKHIRSINDIDDEDQSILSRMMFCARDMAKKMDTHTSGYKLFFNVEKGGGQEIFHLHLHLIGGFEV